MRVSIVPRITNYTGQAIIREVGVIRPPTEFLDLISEYCSSRRLAMHIEGQMNKCEFLFRGPYALVRSINTKTLLKTVDFTKLHVLLNDKDKPNILKLQEEQNPDIFTTLIFEDMKTRDMAHLKLGTWMSYWETLKTNRVNEDERRGFRYSAFELFYLT